MVKPLTVYKASAGSGKTFTLAVEYIRLVVENPSCFRNILAVTFTNKATEEMKMRILSQLYGIHKSLPESERYLEKVRERTGLNDEVIRERAGMALHHLIHHYHEFRVMTIDTFFQSVLRNLARELDLSPTLHIGLNDYQVEELAVDELINGLSTKDVILQWIMHYIIENISDDRSWNVIGQIKQFGRTIFKDEYKAVSSELQQIMVQPGFFEKYTTQLKDIRQQARERMKAIADEFTDILEKENLTIEDFSFGKSGVAGVFQKLSEGAPFDESLIGKRALDSVGEATKWVKKTHPQQERILILVESQLDPLLHRLIEERPRQWQLYKSADLTLRHLHQLRLLGSIEQKVRQLNEENNRFLLSDTQQLLHTLIDDSDSPFIFEKIGAQLQHVMIDEFQDTSTVQWQNFRILLDEAMSHQQSGNLIVGDVKQSIYRWRSGDWRLLNDIEKQFPYPDQQLTIETLDTNYRSARRIVEFNNAFFTHAAELEDLNLTGACPLSACPPSGPLRKAYADVVQQIPPDRPDEGSVIIKLLSDQGQDFALRKHSARGGTTSQDVFESKALSYKDQTLHEVASHVSDLLAKGTRPNEIAILVRSNALIPLIAQYFTEHLPEVSIVSDEAFRLDASSAVNILIDALRLLLHPNDLLTKATLAKRYQRQVLNHEISDAQLLLDVGHKAFDELLPEEFTSSFNVLRSMPLYELVERLYRIFNLSSLESQSAYVCAFFDFLTDYLSEASVVPLRKHSCVPSVASEQSSSAARGGTTSQDVFERNYTGLDQVKAFLNEWSETLCSKTIQSDEITGIRLISIHKSKGLEFPHVIIPFCDWPLEHPGILWCSPDHTEGLTGDRNFLSRNIPHEEARRARTFLKESSYHLPLIPVDYSQKQLRGTIFEPAYNHEHLQSVVDNLNLLYVAFTRASKSLFVLGKRNAKNSRSTLIEQVLPLISQEMIDATLEGLDSESSPLTFQTRGRTYLSENIPHEEERRASARLCRLLPEGRKNFSEERFCPGLNPFTVTPTPLKITITSYAPRMDFRQSTESRKFLAQNTRNASDPLESPNN